MDESKRVGSWVSEKILGSGGFGVVRLWRNEDNGQMLAVKQCKWNLQSTLTRKQRERWTSEVEMMKRINHDNIVHFSTMPEDLRTALLKRNPSGLPILSMEYCSLGNLRDVLAKAKHCCGLPEKNIISVLSDITNALIYLHELNITHRDVKPENIVLQRDPNRKLGVIYKLIDLGYAKEINSATISFVGTLQYLAPEIFVRQNYDCTVDYWSLGIMAFELVCGVRPFLPTSNNPLQSYKHLQTKEPDVICIHFTHTGKIDSTTKLLNENHLSKNFNRLLEKWFRIVLQFEPQKRCLVDQDDANPFQYLQRVLAIKTITIFSVCTYAFYSYEVNDGTLFCTLIDWVAQDLKIDKSEFYLLPSKKCDSKYAANFYDEDNLLAMIFVFKKSSSISNTIATNISQLIRCLFISVKTEFKHGTLKMVYAHTIFLILQEDKLLSALKAAMKSEIDYLTSGIVDEIQSFKNLHHDLSMYLGEIQFYSLLYHKMVKSNTKKLVPILKEFYNHITNLQGLVGIVNVLHSRYSLIIAKNQVVQQAKPVINEKLENYDFKTWYAKAKQCYYEITDDTPSTNLMVTPVLLNILSSTIKIRDSLLSDKELLNYIKCMTTCHKEFLKLVDCRISLQEKIYSVKSKLRDIVIKTLLMYRTDGTTNGDIGCEYNSAASLIAENTSLRFRLQELLNQSILQFKNVLEDNNEDFY